MLVDFIPAEWRKPIYAIYAIIGVILGSLQIAYEPDPSWLLTTSSIYLFIGGAIGALASSNTVTTKKADAEPEPTEDTEEIPESEDSDI